LAQNRVEDLLLAPERRDAAIGQRQHVFDGCERSPAFGHDDDDAAPPAHGRDRAGQSGIAFGVEVRVGRVEHDEERVTIERARKSDPAQKRGRKRLVHAVDLCAVAARQ
jgi:hypothetical protein